MSERSDRVNSLGEDLVHVSQGYKAMRELLIECTETFQAYTASHNMKASQAKTKAERQERMRKAAMNYDMAKKCEDLLNRYR